jgi:ATP-binding cassette subfamily F protein uup
MANPNFLILDEPTNDLDIFVMSVLEDYLRSFEGCLIVVSHDRYFMDKMVDHLFVFEGEGEIRDIVGNYTTYRKNKDSDKSERNVLSQTAKVVSGFVDSKTVEKRKLTFKEKIQYGELEEEIERLEKEKRELTDKLSDAGISNDEIVRTGLRLSEVIDDLEQKTNRWLELSEFE